METPSPDAICQHNSESPRTEEGTCVVERVLSGVLDEVIARGVKQSTEDEIGNGNQISRVEIKLVSENEEKTPSDYPDGYFRKDYNGPNVEITIHKEISENGDDKDDSEKNPILVANTEKLRSLCKRGDVEELDIFLTSIENPEDINLDVATEDGWTCLHDIITHECQFTEVARILLEHGANVNTKDINGDTPLHSSLLYHNSDNITLLLENQADLEAVNVSGRRPIHIANDNESLQLLLDFGAQIDAQDRIGNTALHYAVLAKDTERVKLLLSRGCDVHIRNKSGACPLHLASDTQIAQLLISSNSDPNCVDNAGNSPMHLAVRGRHKDITRMLLSNKGNPQLVNNNGKSPVNFAKDKEMKNILNGKDTAYVTPVKKPKKEPVTISFTKKTMACTSLPAVKSPSILKRKKMEDDRIRTGPRLRFSEVNDYSGVEECDPTPSKRVRVPPIYTDPQFSSDED